MPLPVSAIARERTVTVPPSGMASTALRIRLVTASRISLSTPMISGATAEKSRVRDGVDTFVFRDGLIRVQSVRYTLEPVG